MKSVYEHATHARERDFVCNRPAKKATPKHASGPDKYLLAVTIQRLSNNARNLVSMNPKNRRGRKCEVRLPGVPKPVVVHARPQGSVYIVHNATMPHPRAAQLDEWHEASHPTRWAAAR